MHRKGAIKKSNSSAVVRYLASDDNSGMNMPIDISNDNDDDDYDNDDNDIDYNHKNFKLLQQQHSKQQTKKMLLSGNNKNRKKNKRTTTTTHSYRSKLNNIKSSSSLSSSLSSSPSSPSLSDDEEYDAEKCTLIRKTRRLNNKNDNDKTKSTTTQTSPPSSSLSSTSFPQVIKTKKTTTKPRNTIWYWILLSQNNKLFILVWFILLLGIGFKKYRDKIIDTYMIKQDNIFHELEQSRTKTIKLENELEFMRKQVYNTIKSKKEIEIKFENVINFYDQTKRNIQQFCFDSLLNKYGPGPHYVEIQVEFDPESNVGSKNINVDNIRDDTHDEPIHYIVLQMAPIKEMPHTIYWFLEQVNEKLYDNYSFHINAEHIIQAGNVPNFKYPEERINVNGIEKFQRKGLSHLLFQEYSINYPHLPYTVGFSGRPGGTNFYISMKDNVFIHGPSNHQIQYQHQNQHEQMLQQERQQHTSSSSLPLYDASDADPCFAKVIYGFDVVDRIHKSNTRSDRYPFMEHNVAIKQMRVITPSKESM